MDEILARQMGSDVNYEHWVHSGKPLESAIIRDIIRDLLTKLSICNESLIDTAGWLIERGALNDQEVNLIIYATSLGQLMSGCEPLLDAMQRSLGHPNIDWHQIASSFDGIYQDHFSRCQCLSLQSDADEIVWVSVDGLGLVDLREWLRGLGRTLRLLCEQAADLCRRLAAYAESQG